MSHSTAVREEPLTQYPECQRWCFYAYQPDEHDEGDDDYCSRPSGREVLGWTLDEHMYEVTAAVVHQRLPEDASTPQQAAANRRHRGVVQVHLSPHHECDLPVSVDLGPGNARSFAAALIHAADIAERLVTA